MIKLTSSKYNNQNFRCLPILTEYLGVLILIWDKKTQASISVAKQMILCDLSTSSILNSLTRWQSSV